MTSTLPTTGRKYWKGLLTNGNTNTQEIEKMEKPEWIELLKTDVTSFNALRWRADLSDANLSDANLIGADLRGADLRRADLRGTEGIVAISGHDGRGYQLYAVRGKDGPRIKGGCHWFTADEALAHWGGENYPDKERGHRYVAAINFAVMMLA